MASVSVAPSSIAQSSGQLQSGPLHELQSGPLHAAVRGGRALSRQERDASFLMRSVSSSFVGGGGSAGSSIAAVEEFSASANVSRSSSRGSRGVHFEAVPEATAPACPPATFPSTAPSASSAPNSSTRFPPVPQQHRRPSRTPSPLPTAPAAAERTGSRASPGRPSAASSASASALAITRALREAQQRADALEDALRAREERLGHARLAAHDARRRRAEAEARAESLQREAAELKDRLVAIGGVVAQLSTEAESAHVRALRDVEAARAEADARVDELRTLHAAEVSEIKCALGLDLLAERRALNEQRRRQRDREQANGARRHGDLLHAATAAARMRRSDSDFGARVRIGRDESSGDEKSCCERRERGASDITPLSSISSTSASPGAQPVNAGKPGPGTDSAPAPAPVPSARAPSPAPALAPIPVATCISALPVGSIPVPAISMLPTAAAPTSLARAPAPAPRGLFRGPRLPARPPASLIVALGAASSAAVVSGLSASISSDFEGQLVRSERGRRRAFSGAAAASSGDRANASVSASNDLAATSSVDDDVEREWRRLVDDGDYPDFVQPQQ